MARTDLKVFRRYSAAQAYAAGRPFLRVGYNIFIAGSLDRLDEISLITAKGGIAGSVTLAHLNRLGNANHATPDPKWLSPADAFPCGAAQ